jgi:hypothetical protein
MTTLTIDLPAEVFSALRLSPEEFGRELRLAAAIHWYQRDELSQEMAAQVAGLDRTDLLMALPEEAWTPSPWTSKTWSASSTVAEAAAEGGAPVRCLCRRPRRSPMRAGLTAEGRYRQVCRVRWHSR